MYDNLPVFHTEVSCEAIAQHTGEGTARYREIKYIIQHAIQ